MPSKFASLFVGSSPYDIFFYSAGGFIFGTALGGLGASPIVTTVALIVGLIIYLLFLRDIHLNPLLTALFLVCTLLGNVYYIIDDYHYDVRQKALSGRTEFNGRISSPPVRQEDGQKLVLDLDDDEGRLFIYTSRYPQLEYGDVVRINGESIPPPSDSYGRYMAKEGVHGTIFRPDSLDVLGNDSNALMRSLFSIRSQALITLGRLFSAEHYAFLSGIMFGDRASFSDEFLEKLSISGTMHLTALSGLHISIIAFALFAMFGYIFPGHLGARISATFAIVALFVAMTGFKVSAIRASLMAFFVQLAEYGGRTYSPRNAIILAAFIIVLLNPKSVVYDLGFQLSFSAVLSIIYFSPVLTSFRFFNQENILNWRTLLAITVAAQVGVFPITAYHFANFSFTALPANIAILSIMPFLMGLGFLTAIFGTMSQIIGALLAIPTSFLLDYTLSVIEIFSRVQIPFNPEIGALGAYIYYAILILICVKWSPKVQDKQVQEYNFFR